MKDKNYGLSKPYSEGVKDKAPDWMNDFFYKMSSDKPKNKKQHPFEGIDDPILNPNKIGVKKKEE